MSPLPNVVPAIDWAGKVNGRDVHPQSPPIIVTSNKLGDAPRMLNRYVVGPEANEAASLLTDRTAVTSSVPRQLFTKLHGYE